MRTGLSVCAAALLVAIAPLAVTAKPVTDDDLKSAAQNPAEWLMYGRDYRNTRYSPLDQINKQNVGEMRPSLRLFDRRQAGWA